MNEKEENLDISVSEPEISKVDTETEPNLHEEDSPSSEGDDHDEHHPRQVPMNTVESKGDSDKDVHSPSSEGDNHQRHGTDKQRKSRRRPRRHKGGKRHRRPYSRPDGDPDGHWKREDPLHSITSMGAPFNSTQYLMAIRESEDDKNCSPRLDECMSPAKYMDRLQRDYSEYAPLDDTVWNKFQANPDLIVPCGRVLVEEKSKEELIEENCNLKKTVMELRSKLAGIADDTPDFFVDNTSNVPSPVCSVENNVEGSS